MKCDIQVATSILAYLCFCVVSLIESLDTSVVQTQSGLLRGKLVENNAARNSFYYSFQGIPYAKAPVGERRFKAPEPVEKWQGIKDATKEGSICPQILPNNTNSSHMSEDCLFSNVYTPSILKSGYPVFFWVHGGEFTAGSGNRDVFGPDFLIQENVIIVTINYRLGALGFLCPGDDIVQGNAGLKDVVQALRWVRENIKYFGGDPNKITIAGESAGSVIVHYMMQSKMADNLFHGAILSSGSAIGYRFLTNSSTENAFNLGEQFGFHTNNASNLVSYLRTKSYSAIIKATVNMGAEQKQGATVYSPFVPCVERQGNREKFLTDFPLSLMKKGEIKDVPIIAGFNRDEGIKLLPKFIQNPGLFEEVNGDFQRVIPSDLQLEDDSSEKIEATNTIKQFYFGNKSFTNETLTNYIKLIGDSMFIHSIDYWLRLRNCFSIKTPAYYYEFNFDGLLNYGKVKNGINFPGCGHADDLGYIWYSDITANINTTGEDESSVVRKRMVTLWTNFVKTGDPTPHVTQLLNMKWKPIKRYQMNYMIITKDLTMAESPLRNRTLFWENLYYYRDEQNYCVENTHGL